MSRPWISSYPSWQLDIGNAYIVNDGRAKVECRFPAGSWTLEEFVAMVERATVGWDEVTINWSEDTGDGDASFWVIALRHHDIVPCECGKPKCKGWALRWKFGAERRREALR
jgi:hypothetical protein